MTHTNPPLVEDEHKPYPNPNPAFLLHTWNEHQQSIENQLKEDKKIKEERWKIFKDQLETITQLVQQISSQNQHRSEPSNRNDSPPQPFSTFKDKSNLTDLKEEKIVKSQDTVHAYEMFKEIPKQSVLEGGIEVNETKDKEKGIITYLQNNEMSMELVTKSDDGPFENDYKVFDEIPFSKAQSNLVHIPALRTLPQNMPPIDSCRWSNFLIPTNPKVVSNVASGLTKTNNGSSSFDAVLKPAYFNVTFPMPDSRASSLDSADFILKPRPIPKSLRSYVERSLISCKYSASKEACRFVSKNVNLTAIGDGSMTVDWNTEPLLSIPVIDVTKEKLLVYTLVSLLSKSKRSLGRQSKSQWERIFEENTMGEMASITPDYLKYEGLTHFSGGDKMVAGGKLTDKNSSFCSTKKFLFDPGITNKRAHESFKWQHLGDNLDEWKDGYASTYSSKQPGSFAYYSGAIAPANSKEKKSGNLY